ncbi:MAG: UDP-N-acetylmuramate dehydrogenase [Candidatus Aegiribacteria sp.]
MSRTEGLLRLIEENCPGAAERVLLSSLTTWRTGGPAVSVQVRSEEMLAGLLELAWREGIPWYVLGRGSNVLADDRGCEELVIRLGGQLHRSRWNRNGGYWTLRSGAGVRLPSMSGAACTRGASGLEFAVGIPGTVGGALFMNAGAYGSRISNPLVRLTALDRKGSRHIIEEKDCRFGYRSSRFQEEDWIITGAEFRLEREDPALLRREARRILQVRRDKFPLEYPNAGSVFRKPPEGIPPGKLIEDAGLKGLSAGGAMVSPKHANFIVNTGTATSKDIAELVNRVREAVLARTGITLKEEIRYLGRKR